MNLRGLIVAIAILAALSGALYWSNHHLPAENPEAAANLPPKILTLQAADISKIALKKKDGAEIILAKDSAGKWQMSSPQAFGVDQSAVTGMLTTWSSLSAERIVEDKASDLSKYGLSEPIFEAAATEKNNKTYRLLIGDDTPTGSAAYARLDGDPRIFTIASYSKSGLDKSVNDLRDRRLLTVDTEKISRIELAAKKQDIEFGRNRDEWQIVKPKPLRADNSQVESLMRALTDAKIDLSGDAAEKKAAAAFASGTPVAIAKLTDSSTTEELQIRKNKDEYYAKSSVVEGAYKVPSTLGQGLDKSVEDFRNKKLFDFGYGEPNKIELRVLPASGGPKAYFLTRQKEDWWSGDGKKLDAGGVQALLDKIRDLSAVKFVDSGFTAPVIDLSVTSNDGKRVEKVLVSRQGDGYVAKRENEPSLYELDAKTVDELQKSAEDVKPASPPKK
jgi:hypothetical protein